MKRASLIILMCLAACGGGGGGGEGTVVQTSIPSGVWLGTVETDATMLVDGSVVNSSNDTDVYSETVNLDGLPLMQPGGETPVKGLVLTDTLTGFEVMTTVGSVEWSAGNLRLVIRYSNQIEYFGSGLVIHGTGSWIYQYSPPSLLEYLGEYNGAGTDPITGEFVQVEFIQYAALSR